MESEGGPRAAVIPLYNSVSLNDLLCTLFWWPWVQITVPVFTSLGFDLIYRLSWALVSGQSLSPSPDKGLTYTHTHTPLNELLNLSKS